MTSHELAKQLLALPDLPVVHWSGSCEDELMELGCCYNDKEDTYRVEHWTAQNPDKLRDICERIIIN